MNDSEKTEEIKTIPLYPYLLQGQQALPNCKPVSVGRRGDNAVVHQVCQHKPGFLLLTLSLSWFLSEQ